MTRRLAVLLLGLVTLAGCGVGVQDAHVRLEVPPTSSGSASPPGGGDVVVEVYFIRDARLVAVEREARVATTDQALALLVAGPNDSERAQGVRTALPPLDAGTWDSEAVGGVVVVEVPTQLTTLSGEDQLLGVAQIVWTLTGVGSSNEVLVAVDGKLVDVSTDEGLTGAPVGRDDFATVAPQSPARTGGRRRRR